MKTLTTVTTIGLDIAKSVFQVHGVDTEGKVSIRQQLKRARVVPFFSKLPPAWLGSRPAPQRTTGRARSKRSDMRCG